MRDFLSGLTCSTTITLLIVLATSIAHAQQRGYYWNDSTQRWECRVDCDRRGPPPGPAYNPPRDLYQEYREWGGRNKQICYRPNGQAYYCYY